MPLPVKAGCRLLAILLATGFSAAGFSGAAAELPAQVCVVGGGSGGFAAALGAARAGAEVVLVEQLEQLGGTSTAAYVSSWEPGRRVPAGRPGPLALAPAISGLRRVRVRELCPQCWASAKAIAWWASMC